jgi:hypothetical protein
MGVTLLLNDKPWPKTRKPSERVILSIETSIQRPSVSVSGAVFHTLGLLNMLRVSLEIGPQCKDITTAALSAVASQLVEYCSFIALCSA